MKFTHRTSCHHQQWKSKQTRSFHLPKRSKKSPRKSPKSSYPRNNTRIITYPEGRRLLLKFLRRFWTRPCQDHRRRRQNCSPRARRRWTKGSWCSRMRNLDWQVSFFGRLPEVWQIMTQPICLLSGYVILTGWLFFGLEQWVLAKTGFYLTIISKFRPYVTFFKQIFGRRRDCRQFIYFWNLLLN